MVEYTLEETSSAVIVRLKGSLDAYLRDFTPEVERRIREKPVHLIANLSEIDFIGSRGMGILFHLHKVLTDVKRTLVLVEPSAVVAEALEIGGIGSLLQIYTSETEAVKEAV